jgi:hypothetical protein
MRWFKWQLGRQNSGYRKMLLAESKRFMFDCWLIDIQTGVEIREHTDPVPKGFTHHRINMVLIKPKYGGNAQKIVDFRIIDLPRIYYFRPDIEMHRVCEVLGGRMLILSIGWCKKTLKVTT